MSDANDILTAPRTALPELRRRWPIRSLTLFGSVARGDAGPTSDLDVLVEFERPVTLSAFLVLEDELSRLAARRVDLVSARALKPHIGRRVRAEAVTV